VDLLRLERVVEGDLRLVVLGLRLGQHRRVHRRVLVGLAAHRLLEVLERVVDAAHVAEVVVGVDRLRVGRSAEELRDLPEALLLGLLREGEVLPVGLALTCEGRCEVLVGRRHVPPLGV
jgi:hypothetical protein